MAEEAVTADGCSPLLRHSRKWALGSGVRKGRGYRGGQLTTGAAGEGALRVTLTYLLVVTLLIAEKAKLRRGAVLGDHR